MIVLIAETGSKMVALSYTHLSSKKGMILLPAESPVLNQYNKEAKR